MLWGIPVLLLGWLLGHGVQRAFPVQRKNFQGNPIPATSGVAQWFALSLLSLVPTPTEMEINWPSILALFSFGLLGWVDDRWGDRSAGGFRGHIRSALRGRPTTGFGKMALGGLVSVLAAWGMGFQSFWLLGVDAAIIALSANTVNLFDLRPGRARGVFWLGLTLLTTGVIQNPQLSRWVVFGLAGSLLDAKRDARGHCMLGDTGSNVLGCWLGLAIVASVSPTTRIFALLILVALNGLSERYSFSRIIERSAWLRTLDGLLGVRTATQGSSQGNQSKLDGVR